MSVSPSSSDVPASRSASVAVPPSATVKLSVSATGVLSLTGVMVIVTVAVSVLPTASLTSVGEAVREVLAAVVGVAEGAVGVERQAAVSWDRLTGVVSTVSVSLGRSMSVSPSSRLRARVQVGLGGRAAFGDGEALGVGHRRVVVDRRDGDA